MTIYIFSNRVPISSSAGKNFHNIQLAKVAKEERTINQEKSHELEQKIKELEANLAELQSRFPAHSIPAHLIKQMDEIDEQISVVRSRLAAIKADETGDD